MSTYGNAVERWKGNTTGGIAVLMHPMTASDYPDSTSPAKSISTIVDSAYSSFSGSTCVPDYQTPSFQSDGYHMNDDQLSYMDSEYVKAIYNPAAVDLVDLYQNIPSVDEASNYEIRAGSHLVCHRGSQVLSDEHAVSSRRPSSYVTHQHFDQSNGNCSSRDSINQRVKWNPPSDIIVSADDQKATNHQFQCQTWTKDGEVSKEYNTSQNMERKENYNFARTSSVLQLESSSMALEDLCMDNSPGNYEMQERPNPKTSMPPLSNKDTCTSETKHYSHMNKINKDILKERHLLTKREEHYSSNQLNDPAECDSKQGEINAGFLNTKFSQSEFVPERSSVYEMKSGCWIMKPSNENHSYSSEGRMSQEMGELPLNQPHKTQRTSLSQSINTESSIKYKPLHTRASQIFYCGPNDDLSTLSTKTLNHENEIQEGTKILNLRKDASRKSLPLLSRQVEQENSKINSLYDLTSEKITKATTPMLYHLAGGRQIQSRTQLASTKQEIGPEHNTFQSMAHISSTILQPKDVQVDSKKIPRNKSQSQLADHFGKYCGNDISSENLNSSVEECLMHDYREKLKVAQKKVLRETSFKRKDLQMSLPGRLKLNPPKRPSIDHFRSYSLSSANDESKLTQTKCLPDTTCKKDEPEKPVVSRIGGRKRIPKEQRKLCYSEPEKLDHLGIHNSVQAWREESISSAQSYRKDSLGKTNRKKSLDNKERTLSSSNLSKTELKQIQHTALIRYMERKTNQKPISTPQTSMQTTSGARNYQEWNCTSSEAPGNNVSQKYLSRRSTGASSSYDATVTWNDRLGNNSALGESVQSLDPSVRAKCMSYIEQCTLADNRKYPEVSPSATCHRNSMSTQPSQVYNGSVYFSALAPCSNHLNNRLATTEDNTTSETEKVRGRGKSMEEIGTKDIVRLSVLSQSSDQLFHIKESVILPRPENVNNTAGIHQDELQASSENESNQLPRQTSKEDFLGSHGSDVPNFALQRHSRAVSAAAVSSSTDNSKDIPPASEIHCGAAEVSLREGTEDEVFFQVMPTRMEMQIRPALTSQEDTNKPQPKVEDAAPSLTALPSHLQLEEQTEYPLRIQSLEKDLPEDVNEVGTGTNAFSQSSAVSDPPVLGADNQDLEAESSEISWTRSAGNSQKDEFCQVKALNYFEPSLSPHGQGKLDESVDKAELDSEESFQISSDPEREEDLHVVKLKSPEDERNSELVKEIITEDKSLADILKPLPVRETAMDLMKSLFPVDIEHLKKARNRGNPDNKEVLGNTSRLSPKTIKLLQKDCFWKLDDGHLHDLTTKKMELISSISSKLEDLCGQRELLLSDINENLSHGRDMEALVKAVCKPNEYERYLMFIGDLEKVVSLLFSLSMRLARVENALSKIDESTDAEEKQSLKERHCVLSRQREDAKDLKENLDRRERVVTGILAKYLREHQLQEYKHFVSLKTYFLIEQKDLDEKIKFHKEQLESLHNSIPP